MSKGKHAQGVIPGPGCCCFVPCPVRPGHCRPHKRRLNRKERKERKERTADSQKCALGRSNSMFSFAFFAPFAVQGCCVAVRWAAFGGRRPMNGPQDPCHDPRPHPLVAAMWNRLAGRLRFPLRWVEVAPGAEEGVRAKGDESRRALRSTAPRPFTGRNLHKACRTLRVMIVEGRGARLAQWVAAYQRKERSDA